MLPGVPWMKWALGEPRPGLGCWIGLASVPKPLAHHRSLNCLLGDDWDEGKALRHMGKTQ